MTGTKIDIKQFEIKNILNYDNSFLPQINSLVQEGKYEQFGELRQWDEYNPLTKQHELKVKGEVNLIGNDFILVIKDDHSAHYSPVVF